VFMAALGRGGGVRASLGRGGGVEASAARLASGCAVTPQNPRKRLPGASPSMGVLSWRGGLYSSAWSPVVRRFLLHGHRSCPIHSVAGHASFTQKSVSGHPRLGDVRSAVAKDACITCNQRTARHNPVRSQTYEITFLGQAGSTLSAEFDDCEITVGPGTTTLRADLPDQGALSGLMARISSLGLKVIDVSLVALPPDGD